MADGPSDRESGDRQAERARKLGEVVRELRDKASLTQQELADASQVSRSVIARIEAGTTMPNVATLEAIADALGVELKMELLNPAGLEQGATAVPVWQGPRIKVFVADSQLLFAESLATSLSRFPDLRVFYLRPTNLPTTGLEAAEAIARAKPDVALLDYWTAEMEGPAVTRTIANWAPEVKVLLLSWFHGRDQSKFALEAGAVGFLPKSVEVADIADAVRRAHAGEALVFGPQLASHLDRIAEKGSQHQELWERINGLTPKEIDVLRILSTGRSIIDAAKALQITQGTLRRHIENILSKTGAGSRHEAVAMARTAGIIQ